MRRCICLSFLLLLASCAQGSELAAQGAAADAAGGDGGREAHGSSTTGTTGGGAGTSSSTGGAGATSGTGNGGGGSGAGVGGSACDFSATNTCASAQSLGNVAGDTGGLAQTSGVGSKWIKARITEADSSVFETDLSYVVTLTSPPGMDYDLYVRQGPQDGPQDCAATEKKGVVSGSTETVSDSWDDDQGIGGEDDSVWLSIEVRHVSGDDCATPWSLSVSGG
jgi:hypothetical protein